MKLFECPNCNNEAIHPLSYFWFMGGVKKRVCKSCNRKLKVNFTFWVEFFLIFIISSFILQYSISFIFFGEDQISNRQGIVLDLLALVMAYSPVWVFKRRVYMLEEEPKA